MSPVSQTELESYLWGAANLLRGYIDAGDYKQFIFPLLFYKRICDVYDEEFKKIMEESGGDKEYAKLPEFHRLQIKIPDGAHWKDTRQVATNVGAALQGAMRQIEKANSDTLYGIFGDAQWTNKERLADTPLRDLIEHFSSINLSLENVPQDQLGEAYEYLIKKFADDSGHTAAEFYTNRTLVRLMTLIMDPQPGESIYDPTCGSGGMLLVAALHLKEQGKEYRNLKLYGQEINLITSAIARMNLFLHGIEDFEVVRRDTLSHPAFTEKDQLKRFDMVIANPPYSIKKWDRELWVNDPWGRNIYGVPPQGRADYAFFQHIIKSMNPQTGRCAILFPHGVLFRDEERKMREKLVEDDIIDCVLGLGPNLFYNSTMEACVVFCRMKKPPKRKGKVLFINAVKEIRKEKTQSYIDEDHRKKIYDAYTNFKNIDGFAKVVKVDEIKNNNYNLNIPLYVLVPKGAEEKARNLEKGNSFNEIISEYSRSSYSLKKSVNEFFDSLKELGLYD
jgi:type I restriction enzyme M protein